MGARPKRATALKPEQRNSHTLVDRSLQQDMKPRRRCYPLEQHEVNQAVYRLCPAGTQEVAELIGVSQKVADRRLRRLEEQDTIWSKKVGPTMVWMHPFTMDDPEWEPSGYLERTFGRSFGTTSRSSMVRLWGYP